MHHTIRKASSISKTPGCWERPFDGEANRIEPWPGDYIMCSPVVRQDNLARILDPEVLNCNEWRWLEIASKDIVAILTRLPAFIVMVLDL